MLDTLERGFLEQTIDQKITQISGMIKLARTPEYKKMFHIINEDDYIYGMIQGQIMERFMTYYNLAYNKSTIENIDKMKEACTVIGNRSKEIKEAIFNSG